MTRARTKLLLDAGVLQAWAEGKEIQYRVVPQVTSYNYDWTDARETNDPDFVHESIEWRVKREPRRWFGNVFKNGVVVGWTDKEDAAKENERLDNPAIEQIEVVEVIK